MFLENIISLCTSTQFWATNFDKTMTFSLLILQDLLILMDFNRSEESTPLACWEEVGGTKQMIISHERPCKFLFSNNISLVSLYCFLINLVCILVADCLILIIYVPNYSVLVVLVRILKSNLNIYSLISWIKSPHNNRLPYYLFSWKNIQFFR